MTSTTVRLQPQKHKRVQLGHPWIFSNEIVMDSAAKAIQPGTIVSFAAHDGTLLGVGSFNPHTLIAGRIFSKQPLAEIDEAWLYNKLQAALVCRADMISLPYYRMVHAEADGLPGLIIDRFDTRLSVQINTAGMQKLWPQIQAALISLCQPTAIVLHNDSSARALEGLEKEVSVAFGSVDGLTEVHENGVIYYADLAGGQKTGWYFDQRDNHALVARYVNKARVLDLYCHAGGFGLLAAKQGAARVIGVDASQSALDNADKAAKKNGVDALCRWVRADVFEDLEKRGAAKELYDVVIADPPPFVRSRKDIASGAKGYRKLARLSASVTAPGGLLFIASCSHNMELSAFTLEVARGLSEAKRQGRILYTVFAAPDHPVHPCLPESAYLKGLLLKLD